jgi:alpha-1,3-rhamnosyl/mannosyltransferase
MADDIAEHYEIARAKVHIVGCGTDRRRFYKRSDREVEAVTRAHGVFGDYVIAVGNIEPRKNQVRLVDAFCALPRELTDALTLVLVGAGAWNEALIHARVDRALAAGFKVKLLLGTVSDDDLPAMYSGARCSVFVSVYEGFGMPPLESMACQTPVVSSSRSVMPEVAGNAALLVDPLDQASITAGLEQMLRIDAAARQSMVARGLGNVDRHEWPAAAGALVRAVRCVGAVRA